MERKNTVLLTVIAVATLLVAVVGATFAYFTATNTTDGTAGSINATTATVGGAKLTVNTENTYGSLSYPGGAMLTDTTIAVSKQNAEGDNNEYNVTFNLGLKGQNKLETGEDLNWYLLRTHSAVEALEDVTCALKTEGTGTETQYSYTGCGAKDFLAKLTDADLIGFGTVTAGGNEATSTQLVTKNAEQMAGTDVADSYQGDGQRVLNLSGLKLSTQQHDKLYATDHYYLIVEFPNKETSQNGNSGANMGANISVTFDKITDIKAEIYKAS